MFDFSLSCKNWLMSRILFTMDKDLAVVLVCLHVTMLTCAMSVYTLSKYVASFVSCQRKKGI